MIGHISLDINKRASRTSLCFTFHRQTLDYIEIENEVAGSGEDARRTEEN